MVDDQGLCAGVKARVRVRFDDQGLCARVEGQGECQDECQGDGQAEGFTLIFDFKVRRSELEKLQTPVESYQVDDYVMAFDKDQFYKPFPGEIL